MSTFYTISARIRVPENETTNALVEKIAEYGGDGMEVYRDDFDGVVVICGGEFMASGSCIELDELIEELGSHATEGGMVEWECDGERGTYYVGPPDGRAATVSAAALKAIHERIPDLTPADREQLIAALNHEEVNS